MKKILCILLCLVIMAPVLCLAAEGDVRLDVTKVDFESNAEKTEKGVRLKNSAYIGWADVDMTGVKSISLVADCKIVSSENGETFRVRIGDPLEGDCVGYISVHDMDSKDKVYSGNLLYPVSGKVKLYIQTTYISDQEIYIKDVILSKEEAPTVPVVPDSAIVDDFSDTWAGTDALGRKLAGYEEAGPVKEGLHDVGIFYWVNFGLNGVPKSVVTLQEKLIEKYPDAKDDYDHPAWPESKGISGAYYWGEPLFGYYHSRDYWVYRRHAEMLSAADVDFLLFDWSNGQVVFWNSMEVLLDAFLDAKKDGVDIPELSALGPWGGGERFCQAVYLSIIREEAYADIWYQLDGKYLLMTGSPESSFKPGEDFSRNDIVEDIMDKFTFRYNGYRGAGDAEPTGAWNWLQNYPQTKWGVTADGRVECVPVGTAINHSYEYEYDDNGVFSDPYTKGRGYSEAFGDDTRPEAKNTGYFFREQISRALAADPAIVVIDGWNEWQNGRHNGYSGFDNAFVDTFSEAKSRDMEPSRGSLRDDYYMMMTDFIRKYKGVRKAPLASAKKTIDINAGSEQWADVTPKYLNVGGAYERDDYGHVNPETGENFRYVTHLSNYITGAKVARDDANYYFLVETKDAVKKGSSFMHLYIDIDRNRATGWEGYDFSLNVSGEGELAAAGYNGTWVKTADCPASIKDNTYMVAIPIWVLGETVADFEFKWADGADENGDILRFYEFGSVAPLGRFNYLYTEVEEVSLDKATRSALADTSVFKAGSAKMNVSGGEMYVNEADTRIKTFSENDVLYVPLFAAEEILGYGETKVEYYSDINRIFVKNFNLGLSDEPMPDYRGNKSIRAIIKDYIWSSNEIGETEVRVNGRAKYLSATVKMVDGIIYLPITYFSDVFGWKTENLGNGIYAVSSHEIDKAAALSAAALLD
ncbi:MAG: hypothetical protein IJD97_12000 [Clostridia bacterium]|nr:hypothetical protein [Clostridia bacterium]